MKRAAGNGRHATGDTRQAAGGLVDRLGRLVRRLTGMPDYQAYLAHCRAAHPGEPVRSEREFFEEYLARRYEGGPTRCC